MDETAAVLVPEAPTLPKLREAAAVCKACPLWEGTTQTVFGEGPAKARVIIVGEQPGDREDREGHPFVGPAGRELARGMEAAGLARDDVYITNTVKHFKYKARGKRRIHQKPDAAEIRACLPWLQAELEVVRPEALVCLGATAAQALLGRSFRVTRERGTLVESELAPIVSATIHPSAILRAPDERERQEEREAFAQDLRVVVEALG
ncbi:MAG: UdgX family uracil-DNA binding protein [Actinomycetota bacterium]|nr:UdgX family uracil-DNA binding protein [Actinomycetota bacterium]